MTTLSFERGTAFVGEVLQSMEFLRGLRSHGPAHRARGPRRRCAAGSAISAPSSTPLWALARRNVSQAARTGVPGIGGSVYKLALSELRQRIAELGMDLAGSAGLVVRRHPGAARRCRTSGVGTSRS